MAYILEADQLTKHYGANQVFAQIRFSLKEGEKAGLVGPNGAGKTTLLNCLYGRDTDYEGVIRLAPFATIGFLEQTQDIRGEETLLSSVMEVFADIFAQRKRMEELEHRMGIAGGQELEGILEQYGNERDQYERAGGFSAETQVRRVLKGLGFQDGQFSRAVGSFSGGEKTRIGLARLLMREHPLLFLDEPTNHLDLEAMEWLEGYLKDYPGALLVISHDRYFLDEVTETTLDLEDGRLNRYEGSYSRYSLQKAEDRKAQARAYEKQQQEIQETEAYILRYKAGIKSKQARGRQSRLNRLERLEQPSQAQGVHMGKAGITGISGEKVLTLDQISFGYNEEQLFSGVSAEIRSGERVALLGPNGAGKTTILKLATGQLKPKKGGVYLGPSVKAAYFDQEHQNLHAENSVLNEILAHYDLTVEEAKSYLARFLFFASDCEKRVSNLSGGERGRLSLLKLTLEKGNFLILDEPTNHLDIQTREIMESFLEEYPGTLLMVSHDRYFIDTLAERVLELAPEGLISYPGNYTDYRERKKRMATLERRSTQQPSAKKGSGLSRSRGAETKAAQGKPLDRFTRAKLRQKIQELESEISGLEENEAAAVAALGDPDTYSRNNANDAVKEFNALLANIQARLPEAYREWEEACSQLEPDAANH